MTAHQLRLPPPPGYCSAKFCENRISVANTDWICDECHLHPLVAIGKPCARCRKAERRPTDFYCVACRAAISREWTRNNREKVNAGYRARYAKTTEQGRTMVNARKRETARKQREAVGA